MAVAATFSLTSCASPRTERWHAFAEKYSFEGGAAEQRDLERRARAGDGEAAYRLGEYCEMVQSDQVAALRWYDLSARFGNAKGAHSARDLRRMMRETIEE